MPKMVKIGVNPDFKPQTAEQKAALEDAKNKGPMEVTYVTAMENVARSAGMYQLLVEKQEPAFAAPALLDDMTSDQLKEVAVRQGITIRKQRISKADLLAVIRENLLGITVTDDEDE